MIQLTKALEAWQTAGFKEALKAEIEQMDASMLPLQQGLAHGSHVDADGLTAMIIGVSDGPGIIHAKAGIFYSGVIAGCNCADDPTPIDRLSEYCELQFDIDKTTAETTVKLLP